MTTDDPQRTVSDVIPPGEGLDLPDVQWKIADLENEQVYLIDIIGPNTGQHGEYCAVICNRDTLGEGFFFCSQTVVMPKLIKIRDELAALPIFATFYKREGKDPSKNPYWDVK